MQTRQSFLRGSISQRWHGAAIRAWVLIWVVVCGCRAADPDLQHPVMDKPIASEKKTLEISNDIIGLEMDSQTGTVLSLSASGEKGETPFEFLDGSVRTDHFKLGKILLSWKKIGEASWTQLPADSLTARTAQPSASEVRVKLEGEQIPFDIEQRFTLDQESIKWEVQITNSSGQEIEVGEFGFPIPYTNNYYSGFDQSDEGMAELFHSRVYVHKYIAGSSSYVLATRLLGVPPALVFFPEEDSTLEFTHMQLVGWEGIPTFFIHSTATKERLRMSDDWLNGHSSLIYKPGEQHTYIFRFAAITGKKHYHGNTDVLRRGLMNSLLSHGKMWIESHPGMAVPVDGQALILALCDGGVQSLVCQPDATVDALQVGRGVGLWRLAFRQTGDHKVTIRDQQGRATHLHYRALSPVADLLDRRSAFIATRQVFSQHNHPLDGAILVYDNKDNKPLVVPQSYWGGGGYEGGITDAQFLAAKNALRPEPSQITQLETYVRKFLLNTLQNPSNHRVAWFLFQDITPYQIGRPYNYMHVVNFHRGMYHIGRRYGLLHELSARDYLQHAARTAITMFRQGWRWHLYHVGFMHLSTLYPMLDELRAEGLAAEADELESLLRERGQQLLSREYPYSAEPLFDTTGYEDVYFTGKFLANYDHMERTLDCAMAQKAFMPTWFWCGSDKRYWDAMEDNPAKDYYGTDNGETCMHYTATQTGLIGLEDFEHPRFFPQESVFQRSFASLLGVLTLIHEDGKASMCYTPDPSSRHFGFNRYSGDSGLGLYGYVRAATSYVDTPFKKLNADIEVGYGCNVAESTPRDITIVPIDGLGHRFSYPRWGLTVAADGARLTRLKINRDLRAIEITVENPLDLTLDGKLYVRGLWGQSFTAAPPEVAQSISSDTEGTLTVACRLLPRSVASVHLTAAAHPE